MSLTKSKLIIFVIFFISFETVRNIDKYNTLCNYLPSNFICLLVVFLAALDVRKKTEYSDRTKELGVKGVEILIWFFTANTHTHTQGKGKEGKERERRFSGGRTIMDFFNKRPRLNSFDQFSWANSHPPRPRPTFNPAATAFSPRATSRITWFKGL